MFLKKKGVWETLGNIVHDRNPKPKGPERISSSPQPEFGNEVFQQLGS